MSTFEPLLPNRGAEPGRTAAAEPGPGGPPPVAAEEPDVLPGRPTDEGEPVPEPPSGIPFRRPTPGERLHPEDLAVDGDDAPERSTS